MNYETLKETVQSKGYAFFSKPMSINIIGVRKNFSDNTFNDLIYVAYKDPYTESDVVESFQCTTKPGRYYLENPMNNEGTAIIKEGQYRGAYKIGRHKSYEALEQKADMTYYRDNNKDDVPDYDGKMFTGNFKTNIHRAGETGLSTIVDKWSAGCQVITGKNVIDGYINFLRFMSLCHSSKDIYGNSFTYTLLNEKDF